MFASISLDHDVGDNVVDDDHEGDESNGEVLEVAGEETDDDTSADDVKNVEKHLSSFKQRAKTFG